MLYNLLKSICIYFDRYLIICPLIFLVHIYIYIYKYIIFSQKKKKVFCYCTLQHFKDFVLIVGCFLGNKEYWRETFGVSIR